MNTLRDVEESSATILHETGVSMRPDLRSIDTGMISRRSALRVGSAVLGGITLPQLLWADEQRRQRRTPATADSCIFVFLNGGPSHLDTWDMKPEAPPGIRGEFQPISSSLPGVPVCEMLPRVSQHMHRVSLVRSVHHSVNNAHAAAVYTSLTGHDRGDAVVALGNSTNDHPAVGAMAGKLRPPQQPIVPFVSLPYMTQEGRGGPPQPGFYGGLIGKAHDPLWVLHNPDLPDFSIPELALRPDIGLDRLQRRREIHRALDRAFNSQADRSTSAINGFQARALELLSSPVTQRAFQIQREPAPIREAYGRNIYGQSLLLGRRLVEAGTRVVCLSWAPDANATWDTHSNHYPRMRTLLGQLDLALSQLFADLVVRGMWERTLVVVMGEFGRTPRHNANGSRDHWNYCYSVMLAGGGIKEGMLYGGSDRIGAFPASNPTLPGAIIATVYAALGIPHTYEFYDALSRPHTLCPWAVPLYELFS